MFPKAYILYGFLAISISSADSFSFYESLFGSETSTAGYILDSSSSTNSPLQLLETSFNPQKDGLEELRTFGDIFHKGNGDGSTLPPIVERRLYNTSWAVTIPLFSFKFPHLAGGGFIANQAIFTVFSFAIIALTFGLSFLFSGSSATDEDSNSRSLRRLESVKHSNFNFIGSDLSQSLGVDGLQCLQKIICQANRTPENKKYGLLSSALQLAFPPPANSSLEIGEHSPFTSAARNGKYSKEYCEQLYDCILEPLDSARYLAHWYGHHHNAKFLMKMVDFNSKDN